MAFLIAGGEDHDRCGEPFAELPGDHPAFAEQALAVRTALTTFAAPADAATLAKTFKNAKTDRIEDILETLASLGQARALAGGKFVAA